MYFLAKEDDTVAIQGLMQENHAAAVDMAVPLGSAEAGKSHGAVGDSGSTTSSGAAQQ